MNSMKPSIGKNYLFMPTARDIWEAVREMYSDAEDSSQIFEIKTKLWQLKQGERDLTEYYMEMTTLWQELDLCVEEEWDCSKDRTRYKKQLENERVYEFLAGLNRELDDMHGRILCRRPLPSPREVFVEVRREESWRLIMLKREVGPAGNEMSALTSVNLNGPVSGIGFGPIHDTNGTGPEGIATNVKRMGLKWLGPTDQIKNLKE